MNIKRFDQLRLLESRVDAPLSECLDEIERLGADLRETIIRGDWAMSEATEAKGRAVVAEVQRDALLAACKAALPILEHNATIVSPGHHCGDPNSSCDADCVAAARDAEMIHQVRSAIAKAEGK